MSSTTFDSLTVEAGRETDRRVGEALGYATRYWDDRWYFLSPAAIASFPGRFPLSEHYPLSTWGSSYGGRDEARCWNDHCPAFTTDPAAWWPVAQMLLELDEWPDFRSEGPLCLPGFPPEKRWFFRLMYLCGTSDVVNVYAPTPGLAVVRGFLLHHQRKGQQ